MSKRASKQKGFTLIELLIVMSIVALVFVSAISFAQSLSERSNNSKRSADLRALQSILQQYKADQGFYPCSDPGPECPVAIALDLSQGGPIDSQRGNPNTPLNIITYINAIPKDPLQNSENCYIYKAYTSKIGSVACNNLKDTTALRNDPINNCHYYHLMTVMEGTPPGPGPDKCGATNINYTVEPN